jgi:bacteriorhodopsin
MLYESAYFSLFIQLLTGIIDVWGLNIKIPEDKNIFRDLLKVELGVQTVEFAFYSWMVYNFDKIENITPYRYLDWMVTTPTMLLTLMAFLDENKKNNLYEYIDDNKPFITKVVVLNLIMLIFGLMGELNYINYNTGIIIGFIPFIYYFKLIYEKYINNQISSDKLKLYWFFFIIWALYGVVAFLPYEQKNTAYNILDLLSKNLFGIFLVYILWTNRIK